MYPSRIAAAALLAALLPTAVLAQGAPMTPILPGLVVIEPARPAPPPEGPPTTQEA
jgi:hypothetical protein